jgi:NLR family CARD domain-containing protein 3
VKGLIAHLSNFNISNTGIDQKGIEAIANAILRDKFIDQYDNTQITIDAMRNSGYVHKQTKKTFDHTILRMHQKLKYGTNLTHFNVRNNFICNKGITSFTKVFVYLKNLTYLNIGNIGIGPMCMKSLAPKLIELNKLSVLILDNNNIGFGARTLAKALSSMIQITTLNLSECNIGDNGMNAIASALGNLTNLKMLYLANNNISNNGTKHLGQALQKINELTEFDISINNIGVEGGNAIITALRNKLQLSYLNINECNIGDDNITTLITFLNIKNTKELYMKSNQIGDNGAKALVKVLPIMTEMKQLYIMEESYYTNINVKKDTIKTLIELCDKQMIETDIEIYERSVN